MMFVEINEAFEKRIKNALLNRGITNTDRFIGDEGEVRITGYTPTRYIEITIEVDFLITISIEDDNDKELFYSENLLLHNAVELIKIADI